MELLFQIPDYYELTYTMAPKKETVPTAIDDKSAMLKEAFRCISGTLDFEMLAAKMNVANGEAM